MKNTAQGALEYLLLISGTIIVAAVVITLITSISITGQQTTEARALDALCAPFPEPDCGVKDPDGKGAFRPDNCKKDITTAGKFARCVGNIT